MNVTLNKRHKVRFDVVSVMLTFFILKKRPKRDKKRANRANTTVFIIMINNLSTRI